jgi:hypothetical protein
MKSFQLFALLYLGSLFFLNAQNWEATDLTISNAFPITDMHSHNGNLFATVNQVFWGTLEMSVDDGQTWTTQSMTNLVGFPQFMTSAGNRLYISSNNTFHGIVYYSEDNGTTFIEDVNGLPPGAGGGTDIITSVQTLGDMLVIGLGSSGYYAKSVNDLSQPFAHFDTPTSLNAGTDKLTFYNGILYTYDNAGAKLFYASTDFGVTWNTPEGNGLPTDLQSEILEINGSTGRLYLSGESDFDGNLAANYGLYYSDDGGDNWSQMDLSMVSATNYLTDFHKVMALYAQGNSFFAAFDNDEANTAPDVISSTNFPAITPVVDDIGLPTDVPGSVHGRKFILHNSKIALALNLIDIYVKNATLSDIVFDSEETFIVYPTLVDSEFINIKTNRYGDIQIIDIIGKSIYSGKIINQHHVIDVSSLLSGTYYIRFTSDKGIVVKRFLRN